MQCAAVFFISVRNTARKEETRNASLEQSENPVLREDFKIQDVDSQTTREM